MQNLPKHQLILSWYVLGVLILVGQAFNLVYQLGHTINDSQKIAQLQQRKSALLLEQAQLEQQSVKAISISQTSKIAPTGFHPVAKPLVIGANINLASR